MLKKRIPFVLDIIIHMCMAALMAAPFILFSNIRLESLVLEDIPYEIGPLLIIPFLFLQISHIGYNFLNKKYDVTFFYSNYRANFFFFVIAIVGSLYILITAPNHSVHYEPLEQFVRVAFLVGEVRLIANLIVCAFGEHKKYHNSEITNWFYRKMKR